MNRLTDKQQAQREAQCKFGQTDLPGKVAASVLCSPRGIADNLKGLEGKLWVKTDVK